MKGTYILLIELEKDATIKVGALGDIAFKKGHYCYVGSAKGPGGIEARVKRHLRREKRMRWHIDYLLSHARVKEAYYSTEIDEISAARLLSDIFQPISGFGASDSPLKSHLFLCDPEDLHEFIAEHRFHPLYL